MSKACIHLYDYNIWANKQVISHLASLPQELFLKDEKQWHCRI